MDPKDEKMMRQWIISGCPADSIEILQRPSSVKYPNTFVVMFMKPVVAGAKAAIPYICLDVHYDGKAVKAGEPIQALGGFWAKGIVGDLKPEQDSTLKPLLTAQVPVLSPDPTTLKKFGKY